MNPVWFAMLLTLVAAAPAFAKFVCPSGRFVLQIDRSSGMAVADGAALELREGAVALSGICPSVRAGSSIAASTRGCTKCGRRGHGAAIVVASRCALASTRPPATARG